MALPRRSLPQNVPGFEQIALAVIEQDVGLDVLGEDGVRALLADVPFEWAFAITARVDACIQHGRQHGREHEAQVAAVADFFSGHPRHRELVALVATEQRQLFNTPYVHAIQRLLVQEGREGGIGDPDDLARLQAAFLGISNVVAPASARPSTFNRDYYLATMMRSAVANATEPLVESITRAYAMYHEIPQREDADQILNYVPRASWEPNRATELSVHERFMVGMAVMGAVGTADNQLPDQPAGVPEDYFEQLAKELNEGDASRLRAAVATDRDWLRDTFAREAPALRNTAANSIPFQIRPLLHLSTGGFILSSVNALASWMTRGVHYSCLAALEGTREAQAFLTYVGRLFETYASELIEDVHQGRPDVVVLGEQSYDDGASRTADIAVAEGTELVLFEIEARRFSRRALLSLDPEDALKEVETMVVDKARQLSRCIDALRRPEAPARLPGVDIKKIQRIWPVLVLEGAIAQTPVLRDHLAERLGSALGQPGVERLSILSISDFEMLCGFIEHKHRLPMTLRRWQQGRCRDTDFAYFISTKPEMRNPRRATCINQRWELLISKVDASFSPETRARLARESTV